MANKRSALKAHRVSERRHARNRSVRSEVRTYVKKARIGMQAGPGDEAAAAVAEATKRLDEAASKGVIHRNQAARRKSRLMKHLSVLTRTVVAEVAAAPATGRRRAAATPRTTTRRTTTTTTTSTAPATPTTTTRTRTPRTTTPK